MTETDDLDEIRERRAAELRETVGGGADGADSTASDATDATDTPTEPVHVDGADHLAELTAEYEVVLADFYADWCGPCQMLEPTIEALAADTDAAVAKVDVDANQALAAEYGVRGVPTVALFAGGEPVEQLTGVREKHHYEQLIAQHAT
ncbi:MAG: thioredoxin family protein [Halobacteriaceae archaeon]